MNRERLKDLIEVLKEPPLPGERFNMRTFCRREILDGDCQTACCAAGKYVLHRPYAGLRFTDPHGGSVSGRIYLGITDGSEEDSTFMVLARHFDVTDYASMVLFGPHSEEGESDPITEADVIARVEKLLASNKE